MDVVVPSKLEGVVAVSNPENVVVVLEPESVVVVSWRVDMMVSMNMVAVVVMSS